jgi:hypothetical protein
MGTETVDRELSRVQGSGVRGVEAGGRVVAG